MISIKFCLNLSIGIALVKLGQARRGQDGDPTCVLNTKPREDIITNGTLNNKCFLEVKCKESIDDAGNDELFLNTLRHVNQTIVDFNEIKSCQKFNFDEAFIAINAVGVNISHLYLPLKWPQVHEVNISHNNIVTLKHRSFGEAEIQMLDLSFNQIEVIEGTAFESNNGYIIHIETLLLQHNRLTSLNNVQFSASNKIKFIDVSNNNFDQLEWLEKDVFDDLTTIKADHNKISLEVGEPFRYKHKLKKISLSGNSIKYLNAQFNDLSSLEVLDLSVNQIEALQPNIFAGLHSLKYLNISHNKIDAITSEYFTESPLLSILDLSHNQIGLFSLSEIRIYPIDHLLVNDNNLTEEGIYEILKFPLKVRQIHTGGNKFPCRQLIYKAARQMVHMNAKKHPEEVGEEIEIDCSSGDREEKFGVSARHFTKEDERAYVPDYSRENFDYMKEIMVNISSALIEVRFVREGKPIVQNLAASDDGGVPKQPRSAGAVAAVCVFVVFTVLAISVAYAFWKNYPHSLNYIKRFRWR